MLPAATEHALMMLLLPAVLCAAAAISAAAAAIVVVPTPEVLRWQLRDTGCFLTYNMAAMVGSGGCRDELTSPPPLSAWRPVALDTDAWASTCKAMGGTRIVFTAKHSCGFLAWKTKTQYNYSVGFAPDGVDVVAAFVKSARSAGLGVGFYYSTAHNSHTRTSHDGIVQPGPLLPNQIRVTQQQYNTYVLAHLRELWTDHGALEEIWFDGGYDTALKAPITALLQELQPHAVVFGGFGLTPRALGWAGTENGLAPYPAWSTWSPAPPGPPTPVQPAHCMVEAASEMKCFNDTARGSVLPVPEPATHDKVTLQVCAAACFADRHQGVFNDLAGIDAGNHCYCGTAADLATTVAQASRRPLAECQASPCHADKDQKCGGIDRLLVYNFSCTRSGLVVAERRPLPTSYGSPTGSGETVRSMRSGKYCSIS
eukprot:SAG25_NODE_728_length_5697_cov_2.400322_1_plen_427_part_00